MDATDRIVEEFDRLIALDPEGRAAKPLAERIVFFVVLTRCEIDINGFASVFEQCLTAADLELLVGGLQQIGEVALATEFNRGLESLKVEGFYDHLNWNKVSATAKAVIDEIGERVGAQLWDLDGKLAALIDDAAARSAG